MPYVLMCFNAEQDPLYTQVLKTIYPEKVPIREELHKHVFGESLDPAVHEWLKGANRDPYSIVAHDGTVYWWAEYFGEVKQAEANSWYDRANVNLDELLASQRAAAETLRIPTLSQALMDGRVPQAELGYDDDPWRRPTHVGMGGAMHLREASNLFWQLLLSLIGLLIVACVLIQIGIAQGWLPRGNR